MTWLCLESLTRFFLLGGSKINNTYVWPESTMYAPSHPVGAPKMVADASVYPSTPPGGETPNSERHRRLSIYRSLRPWTLDIFSYCIALGLLVAIYTIISRASNKPEQDWTLSISLNTIVALLSTLYRGLLVAIAAEILSQEKWIYFWLASSPARPLSHLQTFDDASRGIWGALNLLPIVARRSPSAFLAVITIAVSLAIGPFVQQSIRIEYRDTELQQGTASLPVSRFITDDDNYFRTFGTPVIVWWDLEANFRNSVFSSVSNPADNSSTITPNCATGNCTFPSWDPAQSQSSDGDLTHASLGVCNECTDISSLVEAWPATANGSARYTLPNGMEVVIFDTNPYMVMSSQDGNVSWAEKIIPAQKAERYRYAFANVTLLTMTARNQSEETAERFPTAYVASICSLYPCLKTYSASVQNGQLSETSLHSTPLYYDVGNYTEQDVDSYVQDYRGLPGYNHSLSAIQSPCRIGDSLYTASNMTTAPNQTLVRLLDPDSAPEYPSTTAPEDCIYRFDSFMSDLLGGALQKMLNGTCVWDNRQGNNIECQDTWWLAPFWQQKHASMQSITDRFSAIADALTNQFRLGLGRKEGTGTSVGGIALQTIPFVVFQWQWLLLPTILLVLETVTLAWMIVRSVYYRGEEMAWQSSLLPLLFHRDIFMGLSGSNEPNGATTDAPLMTSDEMEQNARRIAIKLRRGQKYEDGVEGGIEMGGYGRTGGRIRDSDQDSLMMHS
ncbi:hypothetical protein M426DRAFT_22592 [Hypoxylon sp. CI-4A]|nr:hypothetical protein M426DRAFT_22592 [Hypoxylon sp. CI-4A]